MKTSNKVNKNQVNNSTSVVCPVCGTEFAIGEHEHTEKNVVVIGKDSGLGTVVLPVAKAGTQRIQTMQQQGIDTTKYFSITNPSGGETLMRWENGKPVPVDASDPVMKAILSQPTVPNRNLFRRWIMSQMFHALMYNGHYDPAGFTGWLKSHGYKYQWEMIDEELRVQAKLYDKGDMENFRERNRWFDKHLVHKMLLHYCDMLKEDVRKRPIHKCKGVPYVTVQHKHYFFADLEKKLYKPIAEYACRALLTSSPDELYGLVHGFVRADYVRTIDWRTAQCPEWMDAYKGMGAYATMKNLLLFHGCSIPRNNEYYDRNKSDLAMLDKAAEELSNTCYQKRTGKGGWYLLGMLKDIIEYNNIDIEGKMREWRKAKQARKLNR